MKSQSNPTDKPSSLLSPHGIASAALALLVSASILVGEDHFPAQIGTFWEFEYRNYSGGWGMSLVDSGEVRWEVVDMISGVGNAADVRYVIEQTTALQRRIATGGMWGGETTSGSVYDSIISPPRLTVDTLYLEESPGPRGWYGLRFEGDSCPAFVRAPSTTPTQPDVALIDTTVVFRDDSIDAVVVNADSCRSLDQLCLTPNYYITADGIGPVAYYSASPSCLVDAYYSSHWRLVATNAGNQSSVRPPRRSAGQGALRVERVTAGAVVLSASAPTLATVRVLGLDGRVLGARRVRVGFGEGITTAPLPHALAWGSYVVQVSVEGDRNRLSASYVNKR